MVVAAQKQGQGQGLAVISDIKGTMMKKTCIDNFPFIRKYLQTLSMSFKVQYLINFGII